MEPSDRERRAIGGLVRLLLERSGMTVEELAARMDCDPDILAGVARGEASDASDDMIETARALVSLPNADALAAIEDAWSSNPDLADELIRGHAADMKSLDQLPVSDDRDRRS